MKTWNRFLISGFSALAMLFAAALCATNASAQSYYTTILPTEGFNSNALPNNWTGNWGDADDVDWFWPSDGDGDYGVGNGGFNGSAMDDVWDYNYTALSTPAANMSGYANAADSVWVDFDFFWEDNAYTYNGEDGQLDEINIDANSDVLVDGTEATLYTYYNSSDGNFDVAQSSPSYWQHYHILIPIADRTSNMTINWSFITGQGLSDFAVDNVTITGYYLPPPELSLTPKTLNFGTAAAGVGDTLYATVKSVGIVPLTITGTNFTGSSAYSIASGPLNGTVIPVGDSVQYGIQFLPLNSGSLTGTFTLFTTGADSGTQSISLTGIGAVPDVSYSATSMFRGVDVELTDTSGIQYLYVNSTGAGPLTINNVSFIGLDASDYSITYRPPSPIPSGSVDSIGVRFIPSLEGLPDAHMVITSTAANIPLDTVALFGVGILPHLAIDSAKSYPLPTKVNFDSVKLGSTNCMSVQLTNPGSDTVAIEQNYFESSDPDFTLTPLTGRDTLIPPGGSQTIQVCFTPIQQGTRLAALRIKTDIPNTETNPPQDTSEFTVNFVGVGVPTGKLLITGPTNGSTLVDKSVCVTDTFWNTGDAAITVDSVTISGANAADFTATYPTLPFIMSGNSSQTFSVCASPSDTGSETAILTGFGTSNESPAIATLGLTVYGLSVNDTAVVTQAFPGGCGLDTEIITVTNTGNVPELYNAQIAGGTNPNDFAILPPASSQLENGGGSVTFTVVFTPSTTVPETTNLNITGGNVLTVPLSATGSAAIINGSGTAATALPSGTPEQFNDTIINTGTCTWTPGIPSLPEGSPFAYVSGATTPIPAGGTALLGFTFTPPATAGAYSALLSFPNAQGLSIPAANDNVFGVVSAADVAETASNGFGLNQNYPNPFNETSNVEITLPVASLVHLNIIDVQGQVVETLLNQHYDAGSFEVSLDATGLASGTYYYQMTAGDVTLTRQMVILK